MFVVDEGPQVLFESSVSMFSLPVRLWVEGHRQGKFSISEFEEHLPELGSELGISVRYNHSREAMESEDSVEEDVCNIYCSGCSLGGLEVNHL